MTELEPMVEQSLSRLWPVPSVEPDWDGVLACAGVRRRQAFKRRSMALALVAATVIGVLAATPIGAGIAHSIWSFPAWLNGHPGTPASTEAQQDFERGNARSWTAFPKGTRLRQLISTHRAGSTFTLYGFRSGDELCLRLVATGVASGKSTGCAPLSDLRFRATPVIPVEVDDIGFGHVRGPHGAFKWVYIHGNRYTVARAGVTFGIVADGVRSVTLRSADAIRHAVIAHNAFLLTVSQPKTGSRVERITATTTNGHSYRVPFAQTPFSTNPTVSAPTGRLHGPAKVQRVLHSGTLSWLTRHEPRGTPLPLGFPNALSGTRSKLIYGRLIQPDPQSPLRVSIALYRLRSAPSYTHLKPGLEVCSFVVQGRGAGGGCLPLRTAFRHEPFSWTGGGGAGSDQYTNIAGIASDQVARMRIFFGDGGILSLPVRDNAFAALVSRVRLPIRIVAYDSSSRVIGTEAPPIR